MAKADDRISSFEDLEVFQRAYRASLEIHKESLGFPKIEQFALADQIRRASKSICANIAEGFAKQRRSSAEYRRYLLMAIGSADEMRVWIRYCLDLNYVDEATSLRWRNEYIAIAKMLQVIYTRWSSKPTILTPDP
jgi:four helix bundle protein